MSPLRLIATVGIPLALLLAISACLPVTAQENAGFKFLEVKVLDPDGQPMADVEVEIAIDGMRFPMPTDDEGIVSLNVPAGGSRLELKVQHDGYAAIGATWQKGDKIPEEFTIPLKKGVAIGGIVHDENGDPIEGVKVEGYDSIGYNEAGKGKLRARLRGELATTDPQGKWRVHSAPETKMQLQLKFSHSDYVSDSGYGFRGGTWEQLRTLDHVVVMEKGIELRGKVTNPDGEPIQGAKVALGDGFRGERPTAETNEAGEYVLKNVSAGDSNQWMVYSATVQSNTPAGSTIITVAAEEWSPDLQTVAVKRGMPPVDFQLQPGHSIRIRVTDPDGEPIAGVGLAADTWRGHRSLEGIMPRGTTDADGIWQSDSVPADEIQYDFFKQGHMSARKKKFSAGEEEHVVVMPYPVVVTGRVVDAETGEPIKLYKVVQGIRWNNQNQQVHWERWATQLHTDGKYRTEFNEPREGHLVRIEAEGYRPAVSRLIRSDEGDVTINFDLEVGVGPSGVVRLPNGKPAVGADVVVGKVGEFVQIQNGKLQPHSNNRIKVATDDAGRFTLPFPDGKYVVVCLHDGGWAQVEGKVIEQSPDISLKPWAQVHGTNMRGKEPAAGQQLMLYAARRHQQGQPNINWSYNATTGADGVFSFDRVIGGNMTIGRTISYGVGQMRMSSYSHNTSIDVEPGETVEVKIGGEGRKVVGKLTIPPDAEVATDWRMGTVTLNHQPGGAGAQGFFNALGRAIGQASGQLRSAANHVQPRNYAAPIGDDGSFAIDDVLPGQYQLRVTLYAPPAGNNQRNWNPIGTLNESVVVEEAAEQDDEPVDLGEHQLKMTKPKPPQQATGTFSFSTPVPAPTAE